MVMRYDTHTHTHTPERAARPMEENMKQPVLVVLDVPEGTGMDTLGKDIEQTLRNRGYAVQWAIPVQCTDEVPAGAITS